MQREWEKIPNSQREVLLKYLSTRPVRVGALAKELGVSIKVSSLATGISGQISKEEAGYVIRVNRNEARERQRFTIGHELAHFLLHRHIIDRSPSGIKDTVLYRSGEAEEVEYEANRLAADIVMPTDLIVDDLNSEFENKISDTTIELLARRYEVSKAAMEIKLGNIQ